MIQLWFFSLFIPGIALALVPPDIEWSVVETPHFEIIFDSRTPRIADEFAIAAERSFLELQPLFLEAPEKTVLWIFDTSDEANGMATTFPRPMITVFPVLPSQETSIGYFDNWSHDLTVHEYAHILNMEPARGIWRPFRFLLGSIVKPNALLPRWYLEGLAVEAETRFGRVGRLRSATTAAQIRAFIRDGDWDTDDISRINELGIPTWPRGQRPYFWGALVAHEFLKNKNGADFAVINQRYAGRVPFFINGPAEDTTGKDFSGLLSQLRQRLRESIGPELKVESGSKRELPWTDPEVHAVGAFRLSPNGEQVAIILQNNDGDSELHICPMVSGVPDWEKSHRVATSERILRVEWFPDGSALLFDQLETHDFYYSYSDLYRFEFDAKKVTRLTRGSRAHSAAVAPKGSTLLFVQNTPGNTRLVEMPHPDGSPTPIYENPAGARISNPIYLNEDSILFSERTKGGRERLVQWNRGTKALTFPLEAYEPVLSVTLHQQDLYFLSQKSGTKNIYRTNTNFKEVSPLTDSTTEISHWDVDPRKNLLYFTELTGKGFRLYSGSLEKVAQVRSWKADLAYQGAPPISQEPSVDTTTFQKTPYSPVSYLFPQYWIPLFYVVPGGGAFQALTGGQDPLLQHSYSLSAGYDSLTNKPNADASYTHTKGLVSTTLGGSFGYDYFYGLGTVVPRSSGFIQSSFRTRATGTNWYFLAGATTLSNELSNQSTYQRAGPHAGVRYSDFEQKPSQISPEKGGFASAQYQYFFRGLGNLEYGTTRLGGGFYTNWLLPRHHVIHPRIDAVFSERNRSVLLGTSAGGIAELSTISGTLPVRGYSYGGFLGWSLATASLEYRFPISRVDSGWDTFPFFFKRWHGALAFDFTTLEGVYYRPKEKLWSTTAMGRIFPSAGAEIRADTTIAYHVPLTFRIGFFSALDHEAGGGPNLSGFLSLTLPRF